MCYLGPDRQYVNSQSPPLASLAQNNNDLLQQIMNAPLQLVGEKMLGTCTFLIAPSARGSYSSSRLQHIDVQD